RISICMPRYMANRAHPVRRAPRPYDALCRGNVPPIIVRAVNGVRFTRHVSAPPRRNRITSGSVIQPQPLIRLYQTHCTLPNAALYLMKETRPCTRDALPRVGIVGYHPAARDKEEAQNEQAIRVAWRHGRQSRFVRE